MATLSGSTGAAVSLQEALAASAARFVGYSVPISAVNSITWSEGTTAGTYSGGTTGTGTANGSKVYMASGTASATPTDIDLTAVTCVDGSTGLSYVREIWIFNDATTTAYTLTTGLGTNPFKPYLGGTSPTHAINPGSFFHAAQILATNGYTVDSSNKVVRLDPGANNVPYRIVVIGS